MEPESEDELFKTTISPFCEEIYYSYYGEEDDGPDDGRSPSECPFGSGWLAEPAIRWLAAPVNWRLLPSCNGILGGTTMPMPAVIPCHGETIESSFLSDDDDHV